MKYLSLIAVGLFTFNINAVVLFSDSHVSLDFDDIEFDFEIHEEVGEKKKLLTLNSKRNRGNKFELSDIGSINTNEELYKECERLKKEFTNVKLQKGKGFCELVGNTKKGSQSIRLVMNSSKKKAYRLDGQSRGKKKSLGSEFDILVQDIQTF